MENPFRARPLTGKRIALAIAVAAISDGIQFAAGPLGWVGLVQGVDVIAMVITCVILGFHPLLLPTFVVELVPLVDMLPTWTGCVGAVILLRKRAHKETAPAGTVVQNPPATSTDGKIPNASGPIIDV